MSKVLVLYYSVYGHIETMVGAVAEGGREAGAHVDVTGMDIAHFKGNRIQVLYVSLDPSAG